MRDKSTDRPTVITSRYKFWSCGNWVLRIRHFISSELKRIRGRQLHLRGSAQMSQFQFLPRPGIGRNSPTSTPPQTQALSGPGPGLLMRGVSAASKPVEHRTMHGAIELLLEGTPKETGNVAVITISILDGNSRKFLDAISLSNPGRYSARHHARGFRISIEDCGSSCTIEISASRRAARDFHVPRSKVTYSFEFRPGARSGLDCLMARKGPTEIFAGEIRQELHQDVRP